MFYVKTQLNPDAVMEIDITTKMCIVGAPTAVRRSRST